MLKLFKKILNKIGPTIEPCEKYYFFESAFNVVYTGTLFSTFYVRVNVACHIFVKSVSSKLGICEIIGETIEGL